MAELVICYVYTNYMYWRNILKSIQFISSIPTVISIVHVHLIIVGNYETGLLKNFIFRSIKKAENAACDDQGRGVEEHGGRDHEGRGIYSDPPPPCRALVGRNILPPPP